MESTKWCLSIDYQFNLDINRKNKLIMLLWKCRVPIPALLECMIQYNEACEWIVLVVAF
jgi:hypothetical protein